MLTHEELLKELYELGWNYNITDEELRFRLLALARRELNDYNLRNLK